MALHLFLLLSNLVSGQCHSLYLFVDTTYIHIDSDLRDGTKLPLSIIVVVHVKYSELLESLGVIVTQRW